MLKYYAKLGAALRDYVESIGMGTRTFFTMLGVSPGLLRRPRLVVEQLHFIGNYSLLDHFPVRPVRRHGAGLAGLLHAE